MKLLVSTHARGQCAPVRGAWLGEGVGRVREKGEPEYKLALRAMSASRALGHVSPEIQTILDMLGHCQRVDQKTAAGAVSD